MDQFPWRLDSLCPAASRAWSPPPDASEVLRVLPPVEGPHRSRIRLKAWAHAVKTDKPCPRSRDEGVEYTPTCEDYIQKLQFLDYLPAWVTAVKVDATFVVFDCGNYVRISIRLRERQTLFLASLIDIRSCKDAGYGGPWTAFDVFAIADAIERVPLVESSHLTKRKSTFDELRRSSKRLKRGDLASIDRTMAAYMDTFPVLTIFFRFEDLDSPAPLLLFKPDTEHKTHSGLLKSSYAVGDVYMAVMEPEASSKRSNKKDANASENDLTHRPFVLKIAPISARARRLQNEARIYKHLHDAGLSSIPSLLSYREGLKTDLRVLIIQLKSILAAMHEAGVLHRDVRSWNIMMDDSGRVRFTDFDRSSLRGKSEDYEAEKDRSKRFIEGEYVDKDDIIGSAALDKSTTAFSLMTVTHD
ncbi:hypothetical protein CPB85DRAFT_1456625 [Mucidula mucida]|nr:hypothetical protein CPB85DRAFT_1456625 [Mucidula mucida]